MGLNTIFRYRTWDLTEYFQSQTAGLTEKGVVRGTGRVTPVPAQLQVDIAPFTAFSKDGLVITSDATERVTVVNDPIVDVTNVVCLWARRYADKTYVTELQVMTEAAYLASPEFDYLIVIVAVVIPAAQAFVTNADIYYGLAHRLDINTRLQIRGGVANSAALPAVQENLPYDVYWVIADATYYYWNIGTGTWLPLFNGVYPGATFTAPSFLFDPQPARVVDLPISSFVSAANWTYSDPSAPPLDSDSIVSGAAIAITDFLVLPIPSFGFSEFSTTSLSIELTRAGGTIWTHFQRADRTTFPGGATVWANLASINTAAGVAQILDPIGGAYVFDFSTYRYRVVLYTDTPAQEIWGAYMNITLPGPSF